MEKKIAAVYSPLYLQLREIIRGKIESGDYPPGTPIPSENALAEAYGIHRLSARNAISALVYEGLLTSVQGRGVFVNGEKAERSLESVGGFRQTAGQAGGVTQTKILTNAVRKAGSYYADLLHIAPEDRVYYVKRVCYSAGEPLSLEEIYIPEALIPTFPQVNLNVFSFSQIYEFYGIEVKAVSQTLELVELLPQDARHLGVDSSFAVLKFQSTSTDQNGRIIEFATAYTRGDRCNFTVHYSAK